MGLVMYYQSSECNPLSQKKKKKKKKCECNPNLVNARCSHWAFGGMEVGLSD